MSDVIYHDRPRESEGKRRARVWRNIAIAAAVLILLLVLIKHISADQGAQAEASLKQNVLQAAVQCYAIEGSYPSDVPYLEQHYGVSNNARKYEVTLIPADDGSLPEVEVKAKEGGA